MQPTSITPWYWRLITIACSVFVACAAYWLLYSPPVATSEAKIDAMDVPVALTAPPAGIYKVAYVVDGDTVVLDLGNRSVKVRIVGIDTPETVHPYKPIEPFGPEATARAKQLLEGASVTIEYDPDPNHDTWGKYGRLLTYLRLDDERDFGVVMISEGLARAYKKYPCSRTEHYLQVEAQAQIAKVGMWGEEITASALIPKGLPYNGKQ